jgi:hypothetical protein
MRLAEVPGLGVDSAQQIIAEVGAQAGTFSSAAELTSWVGTCPGKDESAEQNHSSRSAKGNKYLRRVLSQAAHAAVKKRGSYFQALFRRLLPRLGYQSAIWAIAHRLCRVVWKILHEGVRFIEKGREPDAQAKKKRARILSTSTPQARLRCRNQRHTFRYPKRNASVMGNFQGSVIDVSPATTREVELTGRTTTSTLQSHPRETSGNPSHQFTETTTNLSRRENDP